MDRRWEKDRRAEDQTEANTENELEAFGEDEDADEGEEETPTRRKKQRRRQIDPTTCERDYNNEEIEFMRALDDYKRSSGRMFPTCSEILEVVRALGYVRLTDEENELLESIQQVEDEIAESLQDGEADDENISDPGGFPETLVETEESFQD
ncbi:MAG: hypothetical protein AAF483_01195 [Planctomycetota bacterium]